MVWCDCAERGDSLSRKVRAAAAGAAWSTALSTALASSPPAYAADPATDERRRTGVQQSQFQLPPPPVRTEPAAPGEEPAPAPAPAPQLPSRLTYEYRIGSESDATYRKDSDLDRRLKDNSLILRPELNAYVTYRPADWLETRLGLIADVEILAKGERTVTLPNGDTQFTPHTKDSFRVDEGFFTIRNVTDPFTLSLGRINFEDARHWLYDTSMDVGVVGFRSGRFRAEASGGRQVSADLDALQNEPRDRVETYILYGDYRAFEGMTMAGYAIVRDDRTGQDGRAEHFGARSIGFPDESLSYWADASIVRGRDQAGLPFRGYGFDVGGTYRFPGIPFAPNITVGYAFGSGDRNAEDGKNEQFRQTGLQSNESRFAGLADFRYYGEALDPELSNLKIFTVGVGFRPFRDTSVDFIYHDYELDAFAEALRNSAITAEMNQDPAVRSRDVGRALDVVVGFRNVFGIRRLGVDLRGGRFFPGDAFRNSFVNSAGDETFDKANTATTVVMKLWW